MRGGRTKQGQAPPVDARGKRLFLDWCKTTTYPLRNEVIARLNFECGMRAIEIGGVQWWMVFDDNGRLRPQVLLHKKFTKGGYGGRELDIVPATLGAALEELRHYVQPRDKCLYVIRFRKHSVDRYIRSKAVQAFFRAGYDAIDYLEHSSHSGRREAITKLSRATGIRNAQRFAGHRSVATTLLYEEPDRKAIRRVVVEQLAVSREGPRLLNMAKAGLHSRGANEARSRGKGRGIA